MDIQDGLILPGKRRARFGRYRNGKPRKPKYHKPKKQPKPKPLKLPRVKKQKLQVTIHLSIECMASLAMVRNKSAFIESAVMREVRRIYEKHGKEWIDWPS